MATVNKILLPRRAKYSVMKSDSKKTIVLEKGELFVETSDDGIGKGHAMIKIGDGSSTYENLDYAIGDTSNDVIDFSENTSDTDINVIIDKIIPLSKLCNLIKNIKKAIIILKDNDDNINTKLNDLTDTNKITKVMVVDALPLNPDATTLYLIKS